MYQHEIYDYPSEVIGIQFSLLISFNFWPAHITL